MYDSVNTISKAPCKRMLRAIRKDVLSNVVPSETSCNSSSVLKYCTIIVQ